MLKRISCLNCAKPIPPKPSGTGRRAKYCNRHCAIQYRATKQIKEVSYRKRVLQCPVCNLPFNPIRPKQKLCSYACRTLSQRKSFVPKLSQNMFQAQINKEFITDQIIQRQANKRAALPPKPVRRRGPNPETTARKALHEALKAKIKADRAEVKRLLRARRNTAAP